MFEKFKVKINEYNSKYLIDFDYLIRNEFWVYFRQVVLLMTSLIIAAIFARLATKETYGYYNFIFAILSIVILVSIPGLNGAVLRSVARGNDGSYKPAVRTRFLWSLLGIPVLLGIGSYYFYYDTPIVGIIFMISSVFFPFMYAPSLWDSFLQGKRRFDLTAKYSSLRAFITAVSIIAVLLLNPNNLFLIVITYFVTNSLITCFLFYRSHKHIENKLIDTEVKKYGYFLTSVNIIVTIANNIDKIMIGVILSAQQLAIYSVAIAIPQALRTLLKAFWTPFAPKFSQDGIQMKQIQLTTRRLILPLILLTIFGLLLYWFFIDDIVLLVFSSNYVESIRYSRMLLIFILASIASEFLGQYSIAKKRIKAIMLGYHVTPVLRIILNLVFIYIFGVLGAVWALNIHEMIQVLLLIIGIRSYETKRIEFKNS